ncbi:hypothetical protein OQ257_11300 [Actinobacillus equuli subsp. equuli]|uniref:Uncharacterized protein n=1 Tax=Actinobacillus equuli subsp. equuli TaxID=202947 RepID=A0A9X4JD96_ACTEU|nr:hypothetical protein [Actinobacillus equuli]MDE8035741.1 hypothetical protein [Actinobacillus equuli subsp. equuli]
MTKTNSKTTKVQKTKFRIQTGVEAEKAVTAVDLLKKELTIATSGYAKGDVVELSGLGMLDGVYPVEKVASDKVTLCAEVDWTGYDAPTVFTTAKAKRVIFSSQFCLIKNIEKSEDTVSVEDVTTICDDGTVTEPGEIEFGSIKLSYSFVPDDEMQTLLRNTFYAKKDFAYKTEFPDGRGTLYGYGFLESGNAYSGEVKGRFDSSCSIKPKKRDYLMV